MERETAGKGSLATSGQVDDGRRDAVIAGDGEDVEPPPASVIALGLDGATDEAAVAAAHPRCREREVVDRGFMSPGLVCHLDLVDNVRVSERRHARVERLTILLGEERDVLCAPVILFHEHVVTEHVLIRHGEPIEPRGLQDSDHRVFTDRAHVGGGYDADLHDVAVEDRFGRGDRVVGLASAGEEGKKKGEHEVSVTVTVAVAGREID